MIGFLAHGMVFLVALAVYLVCALFKLVYEFADYWDSVRKEAKERDKECREILGDDYKERFPTKELLEQAMPIGYKIIYNLKNAEHFAEYDRRSKKPIYTEDIQEYKDEAAKLQKQLAKLSVTGK